MQSYQYWGDIPIPRLKEASEGNKLQNPGNIVWRMTLHWKLSLYKKLLSAERALQKQTLQPNSTSVLHHMLMCPPLTKPNQK